MSARPEMRLPDYLRSVPRHKPRKDDPWKAPSDREQNAVESVREGSDMLLRRIWKYHPRVMLVAQARGRLVVKP